MLLARTLLTAFHLIFSSFAPHICLIIGLWVCGGMAQALYLLTVKTMCVILLELTPPPQFHAIEIISPMSHLYLSRKASRAPSEHCLLSPQTGTWPWAVWAPPLHHYLSLS